MCSAGRMHDRRVPFAAGSVSGLWVGVEFLQCLVCPLCVPFPDFESNVLFMSCFPTVGVEVEWRIWRVYDGFDLDVCCLLATI